MRRGPTKNQLFRYGLLSLLVMAAGVFFGFTKYNPFAERFEFSAAFQSSNDVKKGAPVRIAGVSVGKVTEVEAGPDGSSLVHMALTDNGLPIKEDARLKVRPRIFLEGNWFVDLTPGSPSAPVLEEGETIGVAQTAAPVQFGQVLTALQSDTRQDLQIVLDEYGRALEPDGAEGYARSIKYWEGAFRDSAIVNEATLGTEEHDLSNWLRGADRFARGLDRDPAALQALLTNLAVTAEAFASEEAQLSLAIEELPRTLTAGRSALGDLNVAFPPLRRLVADLRPTVRESGPALDAQLPLLRELRGLVSGPEARGLVRDLGEVVPDLAELNEGGVALQKQLRLLSSCTNEVLTPVADLDDRGRGLPGLRTRLPGAGQVAAGHRRRIAQLRRQRPVRALAGQRLQLRLRRRGRHAVHHRPAAAGRQPAQGGRAPAAATQGALRDAGSTGPRLHPGRPAGSDARQPRHRRVPHALGRGRRGRAEVHAEERRRPRLESGRGGPVMRAIKAHLGDFAAILGLLTIALGVSYVILQNQRLRIPLLEEKPFQLQGVFQTGQAVTPGQGQTIRVSGVRVGDISKVELEDGRAVITMDLDQEYKGLVETNWTGLLRPKTGLKDMFIELTPGAEPAEAADEDWRMPISNTLPDVNPDEFLSALDSDTRDYLRLLLNGARGGLEGRANDLSRVLERFEPTYRDLAAVSGEVAKRREDLRQLVHSLDDLNTQLGRSDDDLAELVGASAKTFDAFAQERVNVAATVRELDPTLSVTTEALGRVERFAEVLAPAADQIRPAVRALRRANAQTLPFALETVPLAAFGHPPVRPRGAAVRA